MVSRPSPSLRSMPPSFPNDGISFPVVALTANALSGDKEKYIGAGMDSYLSKPIDLEALNHLFQEYFEDRIIKSTK